MGMTCGCCIQHLPSGSPGSGRQVARLGQLTRCRRCCTGAVGGAQRPIRAKSALDGVKSHILNLRAGCCADQLGRRTGDSRCHDQGGVRVPPPPGQAAGPHSRCQAEHATANAALLGRRLILVGELTAGASTCGRIRVVRAPGGAHAAPSAAALAGPADQQRDVLRASSFLLIFQGRVAVEACARRFRGERGGQGLVKLSGAIGASNEALWFRLCDIRDKL